ncbi:MAG: SRPBCC domain-containing protein [Phycisphaerales bacterium JB039]
MTSGVTRAESEVVEITCAISARPETVFRYFTDPERFARWWAGPGGGVATLEARPGGLMRIAYHGGQVMRGRVLAIEPPRLFNFSWGYEGEGQAVAPESSEVEITLKATPEGTLLKLRHSGLPTPEQRAGHTSGWRHYMSVMAHEAAGEQTAGAANRVFKAFAEAWRTRDDGARLDLLRGCCAKDVRFRDAWACVDGVEALSEHIANALRHVPMAMELTTPVEHAHGYARAGWRAAGPDGRAIMSGTYFGRLSLDGKLEFVVSFLDGPPQL